MDRDIVAALVKTVELKDQTTAAHTWRVALYTMVYVESLGVEQRDVEEYLQAAVLHDVGKIDIPQSILTKPGPLTAQEYEIIKQHPVLGYDRLVRMGETSKIILSLVRSHHERIDGSGYPDGLAGLDIPEPARFFAIIDTFDAMTSIRPYHPAVDKDAAAHAMSEMRTHAGSRYCPECLDRFAATLDQGRLHWIMHYVNDPASFQEWSVLPDRESAHDARRRFVTPPEIVTKPIDMTIRPPAQS